MLACSIPVGYAHEFRATWDWCLNIQFSEDICTTLTCIRFMPAYSIPEGYVHNVYTLNFLTNFQMKDPLGMLEDLLGSMILLESVLVMISTYHKVLMVYGDRELAALCCIVIMYWIRSMC